MKRILKIFFFLYISFFQAYAEGAFSNSKRLGDELYIFDSKYQKLVPLINLNVNTVHFPLDTKLYKGQFLYFKSEGTVVVFVNNQLYKKFSHDHQTAISVDEIKNNFGAAFPLITLYSPQRLGKVIHSLSICTLQHTIDESNISYKLIDRTTFMTHQSALLGMLLLFVFFFAIQNNVSTQFFSYVYNPLNFIRESISSDDLSTVSRMDFSKIIFLLLDTIIISFVYVLLHDENWNQSLVQKISVLGSYLLILFFVKFIYNVIVAYVFRLSNYAHISYHQFLRHCMFFALMILCLYLLFSSPFTLFNISGKDLFNGLLVVLIGSYIVKVIFSLKKVINLRSFYFISYICVSELIPVILFLVYYFSRIDRGIS